MMTKMKLALVASLALVGGVAAAQGFHGGKDGVVKKYDANGDGKLDDAERAQLKADRQARHAEMKAKMLAKYDTNRDGKLDDGERAAMKEALVVEAFQKIDLDGNGQISLDEFKQAGGRFARNHPGFMKRHFGGGRGPR